MKKILSIVTVLMLMFTFNSCSEGNDLIGGDIPNEVIVNQPPKPNTWLNFNGLYISEEIYFRLLNKNYLEISSEEQKEITVYEIISYDEETNTHGWGDVTYEVIDIVDNYYYNSKWKNPEQMIIMYTDAKKNASILEPNVAKGYRIPKRYLDLIK